MFLPECYIIIMSEVELEVCEDEDSVQSMAMDISPPSQELSMDEVLL